MPINVQSISNKMTNGFKEVQTVTRKLLQLTALPIINAENLFQLLSVVHEVFDKIIATARGLEHKLNGIIGVVDVPMINIQYAIQSLIQTIVVNVIVTADTSENTQNNINYSLLGVVDGIQLLLDTVYSLLNGIHTLPGNDLAKSILCLEGIVQTILSVTENLLQSLSEFLSNFKINSSDNVIMPKLITALTNSLNKLAHELNDPVTSVVKKSLEPTLLAIISKFKNNLNSVTESSLNLIKNISNPIKGLLATFTDSQTMAKRTLTTIPYITRNLPSSILSLSNEIESLNGNTIGVQSTFNVALSNTIASFHSLTAYLTLITNYGLTTTTGNTSKLLSDTQIVLILLATNAQTLIDTTSQAISQSIIHSLSSKDLKGIGEIQVELKDSTIKISLLLENVVKVSMRAIQTLLIGVTQALQKVLHDYGESLGLVAVSIGQSLGDLTNYGNISTVISGHLNDAVKGFKMVLDNVENLRIYVRNTLKAIESYV